VTARTAFVADGVAARLGRVAAAGRVAARLLPVDTNPVPRSWSHVTKVDPEERKRLPLLYPRYLQYTDAVAVGGSSSVTAENTEATFTLLSVVDRPVFHEPSDPSHVTARTLDAAAFVAVPQVLNGSTAAIVGDLGVGIERVREELAPSLIAEHVPAWTPSVVREALADAATSWLLETAVFEAYIVQNPESAVARAAGVDPDRVLSPAEAARRATVADRYLESPVVYVEYSGAFGGREAERLLEAVASRVSRSRVWYGGGLDSSENTAAMLGAGADAVVVGDAFHDVAAEEAALLGRAADTLPMDASRSRVAEWLDAERRVADTAAASYLSTVPTVADPVSTARGLLVDSVTVWLRLRALPSDGPGQLSDAELDRIVRSDEAGFVAGADGAARRWARAALAAAGPEPTHDPLATQLGPAADPPASNARDDRNTP
jgi:phosphoglycerol geranylgeranyltransferase